MHDDRDDIGNINWETFRKNEKFRCFRAVSLKVCVVAEPVGTSKICFFIHELLPLRAHLA